MNDRGAPSSASATLDLEALRACIRESAVYRILEENPDAIAVLHEEYTVYMNASWARSLGIAFVDSFVDRVHESDRARLLQRLEHLGSSPGHQSYRFLSMTGAVVTVEILLVQRFLLAGVPVDLVIARDVTEARRLFARMLLADRMMSVGTLAAGVAHEINNPLSYVIGNISYLMEEIQGLAARNEEAANLELVEALDEARQGAERVRQIVRDLQSFARVDHQTSPAIDVRRSIELAINMAWIEIRHRARLVKEFQDVPHVEASEARLGQMFLSLLLNAAHSLPEGSADKHQLRVATRFEDGLVLIEISHTGSGIGAELVDRIFDPFVSSEAPAIGAGIGLSIAESIAEDLRGAIELDSRPGRPTTFRVKLLPAAFLRKTATPLMLKALPSPARGRVLVVDDEPLLASSLRRTLRDHDVTVAESGRQAIQLLAGDREFDLVLCDLMMPELTGMDVYDWARDARPGIEERMVFMTGGTFTPRANEFLRSVRNHRIEKPFELEKVREFVRAYLAQLRA